MPTPTKGPRLGGGPAHERLILANLAASLFEHGRITTTEAKAKRLRPYAERLITFAKRGDLAARRRVLKLIPQKDIVHTLFAEIGPAMAERPGGYTRIVKVGNRKGDNAPMALIELVNEPVVPTARPARKAAAAAERPAQRPVPTEGVEDAPVVETHEQVAVPAEGGDTEVVTEAAQPEAAEPSVEPAEPTVEAAEPTASADGDSTDVDSAEADAQPAEAETVEDAEGSTSGQTAGATEESQAEGDDDAK